MPLIIAVYGLVYCECGEVLALNYGAGWDGVSYVQFALAPKEQLKTDSYRSQRILPALVVRSFAESAQAYSTSPKSYFGAWFQRWFFSQDMQFVKMVADIRPRARQGDSTPVRLRLPLIEVADKSGKHSVTVEPIIVYWFVLYSLVVMVLCGVVWAAISATLALSTFARWLGFIGLFGNFAFLKMSLFYPTLTDLSALFIGLLTLWAYLSSRNWLVLLSGGLGMMIWPTAFYVAALLFLFPRTLAVAVTQQAVPDTPTNIVSIQTLLGTSSSRYALVGSGIALLCTLWYVYIAPQPFPLVEMPGRFSAIAGIIAFVCTVFLALRVLLQLAIEQGFLQNLARAVRQKSAFMPLVTRCVLLCAVWVLGWFVRQTFINPQASVPLQLTQFIGGSFSLAVTKPFLSVIADVAYFGPIMLLLIFSFHRIVSYITRLGSGFVIVFGITILVGCIMTESRQLTNLLPVIVVAVVAAANTEQRSALVLGFMGIAALGFSKLWIPLNFAGMHDYVMSGGSYANFPIQRYFMNHGPWMTWESYAYLVSGVVVCGIIVTLLLRLRGQSQTV